MQLLWILRMYGSKRVQEETETTNKNVCVNETKKVYGRDNDIIILHYRLLLLFTIDMIMMSTTITTYYYSTDTVVPVGRNTTVLYSVTSASHYRASSWR